MRGSTAGFQLEGGVAVPFIWLLFGLGLLGIFVIHPEPGWREIGEVGQVLSWFTAVAMLGSLLTLGVVRVYRGRSLRPSEVAVWSLVGAAGIVGLIAAFIVIVRPNMH
jgi:hypothetical protein